MIDPHAEAAIMAGVEDHEAILRAQEQARATLQDALDRLTGGLEEDESALFDALWALDHLDRGMRELTAREYDVVTGCRQLFDRLGVTRKGDKRRKEQAEQQRQRDEAAKGTSRA